MARIVIELPDERKDLATALSNVAALVSATETRCSGGKLIDFAKIERDIGEACDDVEREAHRRVLSALDVNGEKVRIDGVPHTRVGRCEAPYYTMADVVRVERSLYRRDGERNGKALDAISLRAGVVADGWLPQTARAMAHHVQRGTAREAEAGAKELG